MTHQPDAGRAAQLGARAGGNRGLCRQPEHRQVREAVSHRKLQPWLRSRGRQQRHQCAQAGVLVRSTGHEIDLRPARDHPEGVLQAGQRIPDQLGVGRPANPIRSPGEGSHRPPVSRVEPQAGRAEARLQLSNGRSQSRIHQVDRPPVAGQPQPAAVLCHGAGQPEGVAAPLQVGNAAAAGEDGREAVSGERAQGLDARRRGAAVASAVRLQHAIDVDGAEPVLRRLRPQRERSADELPHRPFARLVDAQQAAFERLVIGCRPLRPGDDGVAPFSLQPLQLVERPARRRSGAVAQLTSDEPAGARTLELDRDCRRGQVEIGVVAGEVLVAERDLVGADFHQPVRRAFTDSPPPVASHHVAVRDGRARHIQDSPGERVHGRSHQRPQAVVAAAHDVGCTLPDRISPGQPQALVGGHRK